MLTICAEDPWRPDTPHSQYYAKPRADTILRPFKLIPGMHCAFFVHPLLTIWHTGAVHHWDEYGLLNSSAEPPEIQQIHSEEINFVTEWLKEWKAPAN